jgi:uncharacterized membrane protein YfcA
MMTEGIMSREPIILLMYMGLGLAAGVLGGWLGIGGGALMVPMLILIARLDTKLAIATSLAVIVPIAISGSVKHWWSGRVDWAVVVPMALGGIVGGVIGAWLLDIFDVRWTKRALALFLMVAAVRIWMNTMPER